MISLLTSEDAAAWRAIRLEALQDSPPAFLESYADAAAKSLEQYAEQLTRNHLFAACDADGRLVGTLGYHVMAGANMRHRGYIWGMYVSPTHRGKGIASALIEAVVEHARPQVKQLHLGAETTSRSVDLYTKHGFTIYGTDPNTVCLDGVYYSDHLMVKML